MYKYSSIVNAVVISYEDNILILKKVAHSGLIKGIMYIGIHTELKQECSVFIADDEELSFTTTILDQIYRRLKRYEQST